MKDNTKKKGKAKKLTWAELRPTKSLAEWRRRNRQYAQRHYLLKQLQVKGAEVLKEAHGLYVVGQIGAWDAFADKIKRAIDLRRGWTQEEYDHAEMVLREAEERLRNIKQRRLKGNNDLTNTMLMVLRVAGASDEEKALSLAEAFEYLATKTTPKSVMEQKESVANFLTTLLRKPDGHYPPWFVNWLGTIAIKILSSEDRKTLIKTLQSQNHDENIMAMLFQMQDDLRAAQEAEDKRTAVVF